eukprot:TRINITY_DN64389_c0_g1_i1.p1 TRINITY_DN64389_c0_g1~~TRINITY_DN64389_c0_g1_i1.p1  ORF type:complete len:330 (-),score=59.26 TRINITY_DN64389_c0_g1_i1:143-1132(-)
MTGGLVRASPDMHEIRPNLWLGSLRAAQDIETLKERSITHVLTVGDLNLGAKQRLGPLPPSEVDPFERLLISMPDVSSSRLDRHFVASTAFITEGLKVGRGVLVHCHAGQSRSATLVAAYLMRVEGLTASKALDEVKLRRSRICPNTGFLSQLLGLEGRLRIEGHLRSEEEQQANHTSRSLEFKPPARISQEATEPAENAAKVEPVEDLQGADSLTKTGPADPGCKASAESADVQQKDEPKSDSKEQVHEDEDGHEDNDGDDNNDKTEVDLRSPSALSTPTSSEEANFDPFGSSESRARCQRLFARNQRLRTPPGILGLAAPLRRRRLT